MRKVEVTLPDYIWKAVRDSVELQVLNLEANPLPLFSDSELLADLKAASQVLKEASDV